MTSIDVQVSNEQTHCILTENIISNHSNIDIFRKFYEISISPMPMDLSPFTFLLST